MKLKELSKDSLKKEFGKQSEKHYGTRTFREEGFKRRKCRLCGKHFWSIADTDDCGDSAHTPYSFFKDKPLEISYVDFWKKFSDYFRRNGHEIIHRYPVVSRWRQDLYFTIAGIQDFQRIENNRMSFEYSANPLLVPQICMRFNDIENVGVTGEHFTSFMMANQTAFNYPKEGYWRDRTIELNFKFLTQFLGLKKEDVIYHEDVWAMPDFSGFGPSLESFAKGAEIVNNVFMQFEFANGRVRELESKVVDVGWGFERTLFFYTGYSNAYEAVFSGVLKGIGAESGIEFTTPLIKKFAAFGGELNVDEVTDVKSRIGTILKRTGISEEKYEKKVKPAQAAYAVVDHLRTLLFAVTDGSLPSNMGGGYNLRVLVRRAFDLIDRYKLGPEPDIIAELIAKELKPLYPELSNSIGTFRGVMEVERERYGRAKENARKVVEITLSKKRGISKESLKTMYESNGVTPELVEAIAAQKKIKVDLPENAYADIVGSDIAKKEKKSSEIHIPSSLAPTKPLYYDFLTEATAKVLFQKGKYLVLDKTPFYPEGGGQTSDTGKIGDVNVVDVQKAGDVIVHVLEEPKRFAKGKTVRAIVDAERRKRIIAHHTATHLISAACRRLLDPHAWQEGAKKEADKAHIDISHYQRLSSEDLKAIENLANSWLRNGIKVKVELLERGEAEQSYGFSIYQGHGVPSKKMRIITIRTLDNELIDAEACGGIHAIGMEQVIGIIKITSAYGIHDGVDRIEFVAGPAAFEYFQKEHDTMAETAAALNTDLSGIEVKLGELQAERKALQKELERNSVALAEGIAEAYEGAEVLEKVLDVPRDLLIKIADAMVKKNRKSVVVLKNKEGNILCMAGDESGKNALEFLRKIVKDFKGGGSSRFAEGKAQ